MNKFSILIIFLFISSGLASQNIYDFKGVGARAAGMAFAFNAVADDATAISWNPAGLTQLKKPELSLIQRIQVEEYIFEDLQDNTNSWILDGKPYYTLDYLSFVYPLTVGDNSLVLGLSYQNQINNKYDQTKNFPNADHEGSSKGTMTVNSISLAAGYSLTNYLSLGAAFNYYFSLGNKSHANNIYHFVDRTGYEDITEIYSFSGFNVIIGAFADFSSFNIPLRLAARVNTPLKLKDDFAYLADYHIKNPTDDFYGIQRKEGTETYNIPLILGTGASYRFGDYLTLALDYDIKPFKDAERNIQMSIYDDFNYTPPKDEFVSDSVDLLVQSNDNLNQFRIGLEYILHPDFALIPVRIGWKNNPTNQANQDINGLFSDQVFASSFNAGVGFISQNFSIDLAYEYYNYTQQGISTLAVDHTLQSFIVSLIIYIR